MCVTSEYSRVSRSEYFNKLANCFVSFPIEIAGVRQLVTVKEKKKKPGNNNSTRGILRTSDRNIHLLNCKETIER